MTQLFQIPRTHEVFAVCKQFLAESSENLVVRFVLDPLLKYCNQHIQSNVVEVLDILLQLGSTAGDEEGTLLLRPSIVQSVGPRGRATQVAHIVSAVQKIISHTSDPNWSLLYAAVIVSRYMEVDAKEFRLLYEAQLNNAIKIERKETQLYKCKETEVLMFLCFLASGESELVSAEVIRAATLLFQHYALSVLQSTSCAILSHSN